MTDDSRLNTPETTPHSIPTNPATAPAGRYRPLTKSQVEHRNPRELLDELKAIETEILSEIDALTSVLAERH